MGAPTKNPNTSTFISAHPSNCSAECQSVKIKPDSQKNLPFPHDYIQANGYILPQNEELTICTVFQKTPPEQQDRLKESLISYIDWRCGSSQGVCHRRESSARSSDLLDSLHLCSHINKSPCEADTTTLSDYAGVLERDGITRLDLLWKMKSYRKWFDSIPEASVNPTPA